MKIKDSYAIEMRPKSTWDPKICFDPPTREIKLGLEETWAGIKAMVDNFKDEGIYIYIYIKLPTQPNTCKHVYNNIHRLNKQCFW